LILIPQIPNLRDLHDIPEQQQQAVLAEINHCSSVLSDLVKADKMNVAALGNLVPQLHIHVIARKTNDIAWPQPVWSSGTPEAYGNAEKSRTINRITQAMKL
jgi:diadenosine tetraphosphate (Ap4A) HIT family hydrolase